MPGGGWVQGSLPRRVSRFAGGNPAGTQRSCGYPAGLWCGQIRRRVGGVGRAVSAGRPGLAGAAGGPRIAGYERHGQRSGRWCGPRPIARRRAPRSRRWRGSAAAPPAGAARSWRRSRSSRGCAVACQCPPMPRIRITGQKYSSSGPWLMWHIGPLACMCRTVSPRQVRRPRIASLIPSSSGNATAAAAQPSRAGPAPVFLRWECASMLSHSLAGNALRLAVASGIPATRRNVGSGDQPRTRRAAGVAAKPAGPAGPGGALTWQTMRSLAT
jgi:hypothetical protein